MAKKQRSGNREARKPKKPKITAAPMSVSEKSVAMQNTARPKGRG